MASASLSLRYALFSSLPLSPSHAANEAAPPSVIASRPSRTAATLRPQPIRALSSSSSSACSSGRLVALARASFPKISSGIDEDPATEKFLRNNSISDFMRFKKGQVGGHSGELQTAVVSYRKRFPWSLLHPFLEVVDLVSTIHIADRQYFETLQRGLEYYDCVLYEMVASRESLENRINSKSKGKLKSKRSKGFNIIGFIQRQMARILSLDFQLDCLDYESQKWQHADLDYETFKLLQDERGESFFTLAKEMTLRSTKTLVQPVSTTGDLGPWKSKLLWASRVLPMPLVGLLIISSVCSPFESYSTEYSELEALSRLDIGAALKIFLAKRLTSEFTEITAAIEEKSVIIGERNRVAADELRRAIDNGHQRIAVLYGGGHMPDLGRRLREEFDMVPSHVQWITAWSIKNKKLDSQSLPFLKALAKLLGWPLNRYQTLALLIFSSLLALDLWFWELFVQTAINLASSAAFEVGLSTNIM
ncbi:unnamed protein product [Musa acuminata subsp. malaccensis]|uniref:(wild Malaysian banana) hypothetical protein n=1 Tax=Musa acuminata subsp. malaccensis TaxID=214687 RepID=A0A8D7B0D1_MUSAM|nr:unnamed protein product [Musa acuminata subsp. malaccensis]